MSDIPPEETKFPPTAPKTPSCPPHYFQIDWDGMGTCAKCGEVIDFTALQTGKKARSISRQKSRQGGKRSGARRKAKAKKSENNPENT